MLDTDPEQFDCESCPLGEKLWTLDADNAEAWRLFGQVYTRLNVEWRLIPNMFERLVAGMDDADVMTLVDRLAIIFDIVNPPRTAQPQD